MRYKRLSDKKHRIIRRCFCADITVTACAQIACINRSPANAWYNDFRHKILLADTRSESGEFEVDDVLEGSKNKVDYHFEVVPSPRMFQWNYLNHANAGVSCFDMDGVLCADPTDGQNDDGEKYVDFILNARPLYIPQYKINSIVTTRLEKYRPQTERWLREHNVAYGSLHMLDLPSAGERRRLGCHAEFKAKIYNEKEDCMLFIESDRRQAQKIAQITGKQVTCVTTDEYFCN